MGLSSRLNSINIDFSLTDVSCIEHFENFFQAGFLDWDDIHWLPSIKPQLQRSSILLCYLLDDLFECLLSP